MPINAGYEYIAAEKKYNQAITLEEKIVALEEMIKTAPKHKGSENLLAELKTRLKKFREKQEKGKKVGKTTQKSIKKEGYQCVLIGPTNAGKSSLLAKLTNAKPLIAAHQFTTIQPELGTMDYTGVKAQIVDMPSIGSDFLDLGIVNTADTIIEVIENLEQLQAIEPYLVKTHGKRIIALNKADLLTEEDQRKLKEKIKSKKLDALLISASTGRGIEELKEKIFQQMEVIRIYLKEPGKAPSPIPLVLQKNSTVKDAAEKILKGLSNKVKETKVTGPSSLFPNQKVGLTHALQDKDIVEFHTN